MADSVPEIDRSAANFCNRLTLAWTAMRDKVQAEIDANQQSFAAWEIRNRVDNPNPLGIRSLTSPVAAPYRTFRYGAAPIIVHTVQTMPRVSFEVSRNKSSSFRTPKEQAAAVAKGADSSHVCWGAHMSNMARHIVPTVDGTSFVDGGKFEKRLGEYFPQFKTLWVSELQANGLRDAGGGFTWYNNSEFKDELHVELPNAKFGQTDPRAEACVDEYARLLKQVEGTTQNLKFEEKLQAHLKLILKNALQNYSQ